MRLKNKKNILGIISYSAHYYDHNGDLYTYPLLAKQFDQLSRFFDEVIICTPCLLHGLPDKLFSKYSANNIKIISLPSAGGKGFVNKINIIVKMITWRKAINDLIKISNLIHIRFPDHIGALGLILLKNRNIKTFGIYTGTWKQYKGEPWTYRIIKKLIKTNNHFPTGIYSFKNNKKNLFNNFSPSYSDEKLKNENKNILKKISLIKKSDTKKIELLTVGFLSKNKNQIYILKSLKKFIIENVNIRLNVVGDGTEKSKLVKFCKKHNLLNNVVFHGSLEHSKLINLYRKSDFTVQSPKSEGFGKVPIESMAHGSIPIISKVGISEYLVGDELRGISFKLDENFDSIFYIIQKLMKSPIKRVGIIKNGYAYAKNYTLESWTENIEENIKKFYN